MARYPIKQLKDKNRVPFFPFNILESVLVDGTDKTLKDVLDNIYNKDEINTMFSTELSKFSVYSSTSDLPSTARDGAVAAVNANNTYIMYMYYDNAWRALTQKGDKGDPGAAGAAGRDGTSPTANVLKSGNTATITITDKNGTTTASVSDGTDGADGRDGRDGYVQYTAGDNINISDEDVISATDTKYTAGTNISINSSNVISADLSSKQDKIDSSHKLNADLVDDTSSTNKFTSASEKTTWNGKYAKPGTGIPKTDLSSDVQTSLGKADSALQEHQDISGKQDIIQYSTVPTAASSLVGKIIQYIGATDSSYTNGYFYKCINNGGTYTWENIDVQTNNGGGTGGASILLKTISDTAPTTGLAEDDKYYSITNNKIYTYDGSVWNEGETPEVGQYYITTDLYQSYIYDTIKTALVPTNEFVYIWDGTQVGSGDARLPIFNYYIKLLKRNIPATIKVVLSNYNGTTHPFDFRVIVDLVPITNPRAADIYLSGFTGLFTVNSYLYKYSAYVQNDRNVVNVVQSGNLYCYDFVAAYSSSYANANTAVLTTNNTKAFTPNSDYNPSTVKFVKDTVDDKTILLNYDGGEHNKIYLSSANTFGTTAPSSDVESGYHGPDYTINYTYTSAQSITPATKYLLHLVKMLKSSSITGQDITADISIIRDNSAILTKTISIGTILSISGTANTTTVTLEGEFSFGLDEPLAIQNGDIFRIVLKSSYNYSFAFAGVIYSSSTNPTYIEQYSGGVDSNYVYDTIGGVTKTQHEINAQIGDINTILNSLVSVGGGN